MKSKMFWDIMSIGPPLLIIIFTGLIVAYFMGGLKLLYGTMLMLLIASTIFAGGFLVVKWVDYCSAKAVEVEK